MRSTIIKSLLTAEQVAERLSVSVRSVRRWIAEGNLPVVRLGRAVRVEERDLQVFLAERRQG